MTLKKSKAVLESQEQEAAQSVAHKPAFKHLTDEQLLVNELAQIDAYLKAHDVQSMLDKKEEHKKKLAALAQNGDPAQEVTFHGTDGNKVVFSPAPVCAEITDKKEVIAMLGQETFNAVAKITLTEAKKYLSEGELADCTSKTYGTRRLKYIGK